MAKKDIPPLSEEQVVELVDEGLLNATRSLGIQAVRHHNCIMTGYDLLHFNVTSTQVQGAEGTWVGAAIVGEVRLKDPFGNVAVIEHLVNGMGSTAREAINSATQNWVEGALPPLCLLFGVKHGESRGTLKLNTYTEGDAQGTAWEGFLGPVQYWGDDNLRQVVTGATPYGLVNQPLTNYLHKKTLHWVKVFGVRHPSGETEFTVAIDNKIDPYACSVAEANFDWTPFPHPCSFRQFWVVRPKKPIAVEDDPRLSQAMKEHNFRVGQRAQEHPDEPDSEQKKKRSWFPFGRRSH